MAGEPVDDDDAIVVSRVLDGDVYAFEALMRRHNRRLFRAARAIVRRDDEAEDVVQEAYVRAYASLAQYRGEAPLSAWLTKIAVHEALRRVRHAGRFVSVDDPTTDASERTMSLAAPATEDAVSRSEARSRLRTAVDALPEALRIVFMLRDVEEASTAETASILGLSEGAVKVRLHRARTHLRESLSTPEGVEPGELFAFAGERCDRVVAHVMERITSGRGLRRSD